MATIVKPHNTSVIAVTIVVGMLLMLIPLPDAARHARPEWVVMTLIYWAMALPQRVGIGVAWLTGLLMDALMGGVLGIMAFSYAFAIYLIARFHLQLRQYPLWQQALTILSLVFMVKLVAVLTSSVDIEWVTWMSALTSTLLWPLMYAVLRKVRRTFRVS